MAAGAGQPGVRRRRTTREGRTLGSRPPRGTTSSPSSVICWRSCRLSAAVVDGARPAPRRRAARRIGGAGPGSAGAPRRRGASTCPGARGAHLRPHRGRRARLRGRSRAAERRRLLIVECHRRAGRGPPRGALPRRRRRVVADGVRHIVDVEVMPREGPADHDPPVAVALDEDDLAQPRRVAGPPASVRVRPLGALDVVEGDAPRAPGRPGPGAAARAAATRRRSGATGAGEASTGRGGSGADEASVARARPAATTPPPPMPRAARLRGAGRAPSTGAARRRRPPTGSSRGRRGRRATRRPTLRGPPLPSRSAPPGPAADPAPAARRALPGCRRPPFVAQLGSRRDKRDRRRPPPSSPGSGEAAPSRAIGLAAGDPD